MGKVALLAIAAFAILGGFYSTSAQRGMINASEGVSKHQYEVLARSAALAGFDLAKQQLSDDYDDLSDFSGSYGTGDYTVTVDADGVYRSINIDAEIPTPDGGSKTYKIGAKVEKVLQIPEQAPHLFQHAMFSNGDLTLKGETTSDTVGTVSGSSNVYNANVHTNGILKVVGGNVRVYGFGTYGISGTATKPELNFQPYYNPTGEPVMQMVPIVPVKTFIPDSMQAQLLDEFEKTEVDSVTAGLILNDKINFINLGATREKPFIWRVNGNLEVRAGTELKGYCIFIVDGQTSFTGNATLKLTGNKSESSVAFYSNLDITVGSSVTIMGGQIFTNTNFTFNGSPVVSGNVVAAGTILGTGEPTINFLPPSPALTSYWEPFDWRLKLLAYTER